MVLYHHRQGELLLACVLCPVPSLLPGDSQGTNFELLNSSCLSSDIVPTDQRRSSSGQLTLGLCTWSSEAWGVERAPARAWGWLPEGWKPLGQQNHRALLPAASASWQLGSWQLLLRPLRGALSVREPFLLLLALPLPCPRPLSSSLLSLPLLLPTPPCSSLLLHPLPLLFPVPLPLLLLLPTSYNSSQSSLQ